MNLSNVAEGFGKLFGGGVLEEAGGGIRGLVSRPLAMLKICNVFDVLGSLAEWLGWMERGGRALQSEVGGRRFWEVFWRVRSGGGRRSSIEKKEKEQSTTRSQKPIHNFPREFLSVTPE